MRLFKRMKDPVRGSGEVMSQMAPLMGGSGDLRLILTADSVPPTPVELSVSALNVKAIARWPQERDQVPVTVDRANPQNFRIEWDEMPENEVRARKEEDEAIQKRLAEMGAGVQPEEGGEARGEAARQSTPTPLSQTDLSPDQAARVQQALGALGISDTSGVRVLRMPGAREADTDPIDRLEKLDQLRKSGALTEAEFDREKRRILHEQ